MYCNVYAILSREMLILICCVLFAYNGCKRQLGQELNVLLYCIIILINPCWACQENKLSRHLHKELIWSECNEETVTALERNLMDDTFQNQNESCNKARRDMWSITWRTHGCCQGENTDSGDGMHCKSCREQ